MVTVSSYIKSFFNRFSRFKLKTILDEDLIEYLKSTNKFDAISKGKIKCHFCNKIITIKNLGALIGQNKIICHDSNCMLKVKIQ